ncbi:MAG: hypothetical protein WAK57_12030 [Desulfobacterales bacterium]
MAAQKSNHPYEAFGAPDLNNSPVSKSGGAVFFFITRAWGATQKIAIKTSGIDGFENISGWFRFAPKSAAVACRRMVRSGPG